ncbi:beta strand repeat-containing protein [Citrobacter meridianamericanus]
MMRKYLSLFFIFLCALMAVCLEATGAPVSSQTQPVKGHAPVVTGVGITGPGTPVAGDTLRLGGTFSDPDGDAESGSLLQWYHSDGTPVATGQEYVIQAADAGKRIQAGYTPKTDPALTDPDTGTEVKSALTLLIMGKPDGTQSTFTRTSPVTNTISADGSDKAVLTLTLKDIAGNPVSGIAGRLSLAHTATSGTDAVLLTTDDKGNGVYDFLVTGTDPGTIVFTPQLDGVNLTTTPATQTLIFTGTLSQAQLTTGSLTVTRDNAVADDSATNQVRAVVTDNAGRPVAGATVSFSTVLPAHITTSTGVTDITGVATASLASPKSGPVNVTATVTSPNTGSTQTVPVTFTAGMPLTANSTLAVSHASITANGGGTGGTSIVTLALKDAKNNPVTGRTDVAFTVSGVTGTTLTAVTESPAESGVYTATLSGTTSGTATVGTTVGGSAFSATPAIRTVTLTPDLSTAVVSGLDNTTSAATKLANNTDLHSLQATVQDANGNPVPGAVVAFSVTAKSGAGGTPVLSSATGTTDVSGKTPLITLKDTTAETVTVTARVSTNVADTGKTADATFALYPVVSAVTPGTNNSPADGVTQNTLVVQVSDLAGNAINNQSVTLNFAGTDLKTGPATLKYNATTLTAGSTSVPVTTDAGGQVLLTATDITAETVTVSAKTTSSTQAAITATSTFSIYPVLTALTVGTNNVPADNASYNTLVATLTDKKGTLLPNGTPVTLTLSASTGTVVFASASPWTTTITNTSGQVTVSLKDNTVESVDATVSVPSGNKTATVYFAPNIAFTTFNGGKTDGSQQGTAVATITNPTTGAPLSNMPVTYTVTSGSATLTAASGTTNAAGQYTSAVTSSVQGPVTLTATTNGGKSAQKSSGFLESSLGFVDVTGKTYPSSGFPRRGFLGGRFVIRGSAGAAVPTGATWSASTGNLSVVASGNGGQVTIAGTPSSGTLGYVTVSYPGVTVQSPNFTPTLWYAPSTGAMTTGMTIAQMTSLCTSMGAQWSHPAINANLSPTGNATSPGSSVNGAPNLPLSARDQNTLWGEWGDQRTNGLNVAEALWNGPTSTPITSTNTLQPFWTYALNSGVNGGGTSNSVAQAGKKVICVRNN